MIDVDAIRRDYPEFTDQGDYPADGVTFYLKIASLLLRTEAFGQPSATTDVASFSMYDIATELFVAHHLVLEKQAKAQAALGGDPGTKIGAITAKSSGPLSTSYDVSAGINPGDGHWNQTTYGTRFRGLCRLFGAGPIQLGVGAIPVGAGFGAPWSGPWVYLVPNPSNAG